MRFEMLDTATTTRSDSQTGNRWLVYQAERFPFKKYTPLVAAFAASGLALSYMVSETAQLPSIAMYVTAFAVTLMVFMQLRISDEIKDAAFDREHYPERPVPRGLVNLEELKKIGLGLAVLQAALVMHLEARLLMPLGAIWLYLYLMHNEFFVGSWLREHPIVYMLSHMGILFFTDFFITACHWMVASTEPSYALLFFFGTSFKLGMIIEIGRKIKAPIEERSGAGTYSASWGADNATIVWLLTMFASLVFAVLTASKVGFGFGAAAIGSVIFLFCLATGLRFIKERSPDNSKAIENISGIWTLSLYLLMGIVPLGLKLIA